LPNPEPGWGKRRRARDNPLQTYHARRREETTVPRFHRTIEIDDVDVVRETPRALLCEIGERSVWVPKSQLAIDSEVRRAGDHGVLIVSEWFAEQADLEAHAAEQVNLSTLPTAAKIYRQLALAHHPDRAGGDDAVMRALNALWDAVKQDLRALAEGGGR
jgi:hypothetical protein